MNKPSQRAFPEDIETAFRRYDVETGKAVADALKACGYKKIVRIPQYKSFGYILNEPKNLLNFLTGARNNVFAFSLFPKFYRLLFALFFPRVFSLYRIFFLNQLFNPNELPAQFDDHLKEKMLEYKFILPSPGASGKYVATFSAVPFGKMLLFRDGYYVYSKEHVIANKVWVGWDSMQLVTFNATCLPKFNRKFSSALEVGTGTGIQLFNLLPFCERLSGFDNNGRAVFFTNFNAAINRVGNLSAFLSDMYEKVTEKYDLIVSNPYWLDEATGGTEEVPFILEKLDEYLADNGVCIIYIESFIKDGNDYNFECVKDFLKKHENYDAVVCEMNYFTDIKRIRHWKKLNISFKRGYALVLNEGGTGKVNVNRLPWFSRLGFAIFSRIKNMASAFLPG